MGGMRGQSNGAVVSTIRLMGGVVRRELSGEEGHQQRKAEILWVYQERSSMCRISRTFGVARQTLAKWLGEAAVVLPDTLPAADAQLVRRLASQPCQTPEQYLNGLERYWYVLPTPRTLRWI